jgi:hypothetical protein
VELATRLFIYTHSRVGCATTKYQSRAGQPSLPVIKFGKSEALAAFKLVEEEDVAFRVVEAGGLVIAFVKHNVKLNAFSLKLSD